MKEFIVKIGQDNTASESGSKSFAAEFVPELSLLPESHRILPDYQIKAWRYKYPDHLEKRLRRNPRDLLSHVQRILLHRAQKKPDQTYGALLDLFLVLGSRGQALRKNILKRCRKLLAEKHYRFLKDHLETGLYKDFIRDSVNYSFLSPGTTGNPAIVANNKTQQSDWEAILLARHYLAKNNILAAQRLLKLVLQTDPGNAVICRELLSLYRLHNLPEAFFETYYSLLGRQLALPENWRAAEQFFKSGATTENSEASAHSFGISETMTDYRLLQEFYILPTAAGAYYAVSSPVSDPLRRLLLILLKQATSIKVNQHSLRHEFGLEDEQAALEQLHTAQSLSLIQGYQEPQRAPSLGIGQEIQDLLPQLSSAGKALLVDWNGLPLAHCGIDDKTAQMLSALSADLISVQQRHAERLQENLGLDSQGWAAVDAYGASRIGAWPLYVGSQKLMLVILGEPHLNRSEFITLVWILICRYSQ